MENVIEKKDNRIFELVQAQMKTLLSAIDKQRECENRCTLENKEKQKRKNYES